MQRVVLSLALGILSQGIFPDRSDQVCAVTLDLVLPNQTSNVPLERGDMGDM
jgi:hypothetical protein